MTWAQTAIKLNAKPRGCHLITHEIERQLPDLRKFTVGMANVFGKLMRLEGECTKDQRERDKKKGGA